MEEYGALGVVPEGELSKKDAIVGRHRLHSRLWARFFDENVPLRKRVWLNHLYSSNFMLLLF